MITKAAVRAYRSELRISGDRFTLNWLEKFLHRNDMEDGPNLKVCVVCLCLVFLACVYVFCLCLLSFVSHDKQRADGPNLKVFVLCFCLCFFLLFFMKNNEL